MSDGGGDSGGGKGGGDGKGGGGGGGSTGFSDPTPVGSGGGQSISSTGATPSTSSAIPIVGGSGTFSAGDGGGTGGGLSGGSGDGSALSFGSGTSSQQSSNPLASTASLGNPSGITSSGSGGGVASSLGLAPPVGFGSSPTDLSSNYDPFSTASNNGQAVPQANAAQGATALTPQQLGQPAPAATGATAAPAAAAGGGDKSILDSLGIKNPVGAAVGAAGLGYSILQGQQSAKYSPEMLAQAQSLNAQGQQLLSYLQNGNLPPGLQQSLTQATSAAKAKIISNFAAQGMNTDPTQNTALAQELAAVDQQALISTAQIGQQLMTSGIQETGLSSDLYKTLANIDQTQTANIGKAISSFAASLSGGGGLSLKLG